MKRCVWCAEEIQDSAKKCKHCGEWLNTAELFNDTKVSESKTEIVENSTSGNSDIAEDATVHYCDIRSSEVVDVDSAVQPRTPTNGWSAVLSWVLFAALVCFSAILGALQMYFFATEEAQRNFAYLSWFDVQQELSIARLSGGLGYSAAALVFSMAFLPLFRKTGTDERFLSAWRADKAITLGILIRLFWTFGFSPNAVDPLILFQEPPTTRQQLLAWVRKHEDMLRSINSGQKLESENFTVEDYGQGAEILRVTNNSWIKLQQNFEDFRHSVDTAKLNLILLPENLSSSDGRESGLVALDVFADSINRCEAQTEQWLVDTPAKLGAAELPADIRQDAVVGFNGAVEQTRNALEQFFKIERDFIAAVRELINFTTDKQPQLSVKSGKLIFSTDAEVAIYNEFIIKIQDLAQRESAWLLKTQLSNASSAKQFHDQTVKPLE